MRVKTVSSAPLAILFCLLFAFGCAQSAFKSAMTSLERKDYAGAVGYLEQGAENGDRRCAYLLGSILISGKASEPNPTEGARWMRVAAEAELPVAQAYLGTLYANGEGVETDLAEAAEWYRKAAEYGDPLGQAAFGAAIFHGIGVTADLVEGYKWTKLAADQGFLKAVSNLPAMREALTGDQQKQADKQVARFDPKEDTGRDSDFSGNRQTRGGNHGRRAAQARSYPRAGHVH